VLHVMLESIRARLVIHRVDDGDAAQAGDKRSAIDLHTSPCHAFHSRAIVLLIILIVSNGHIEARLGILDTEGVRIVITLAESACRARDRQRHGHARRGARSLGLSTSGYTDASLTGVAIKAVHFPELRDRVQ